MKQDSKKTSYFVHLNRLMNVVITGASRGLGKAIAEKFAGDKQGHTILLSSRSKEKLEQSAKDLQDRFPQATIKWFACDLSNKQDVQRLGDWLLEQIPQ